MSAIGSKVSTDNLLDAKSLMKLVEMLTTKSELESLKSPQPNAATDPAKSCVVTYAPLGVCYVGNRHPPAYVPTWANIGTG